ncbi:hypothetical protein OG427_17845 [Streptomyces sp. NBC_00133]|uniref:hypothetical protein n=1 Tax=Streptomyces sp. NBC_00133 TaxID=2903624 RepID=UPI0032566DCF
MGLRKVAQEHITQSLVDRVRAIEGRMEPGEVPIASSAGELGRREPVPPEGATIAEVKAHFPAPDGDFVLTDKNLYYRDPRGMVYKLPLRDFVAWRQQISDSYPTLSPALRRRILEIDVRLSDGSRYVIESGKLFARQIRRVGRVRRRW